MKKKLILLCQQSCSECFFSSSLVSGFPNWSQKMEQLRPLERHATPNLAMLRRNVHRSERLIRKDARVNREKLDAAPENHLY